MSKIRWNEVMQAALGMCEPIGFTEEEMSSYLSTKEYIDELRNSMSPQEFSKLEFEVPFQYDDD